MLSITCTLEEKFFAVTTFEVLRDPVKVSFKTE